MITIKTDFYYIYFKMLSNLVKLWLFTWFFIVQNVGFDNFTIYPLQIIHIFYLAHHRYWCNHVTFRLLTIPRGEIDMVPDVTQLRLLALFYSCIRKSANACIWFLQLFKMHILHAIIFSYSTLNAFDFIEHVTHM